MRHQGSAGISLTMPTPAQLEAAITAMCLVGFADGELSADELGTLGRELDAAGWCEALTEEQIDELLVRSADRAHAIWELPDAARDDAIVELALALDSIEMRRAAYAMARAVAAVDGDPTDEEATALATLARAAALV